jgi:superfamily II DNA or RNA helicase
VVEAHRHLAADRPTLVFAVDLAHVEKLTRAFADAGVPVASVTGQMKPEQRRLVLEDFRAGRLTALVSCEVLTEGYDERSVSCIVMARPTQSRALYQQCVGRGLRIDPEGGKTDCLVIDLVDRCIGRRVVAASDLFDAHVEDCGGRDVRDAAREEKERWRLEPLTPGPGLLARWETRKERRWAELPTLRGYSPPGWWHAAPATERQLKFLKKSFSFDVLRSLTKGEASHLIEESKRLDKLYPTPATEDQEALLRSKGRWRNGMNKREAQQEIGRLMAGAR